MKDFFVSYNSADLGSAEWIAWVLEEKGYSVIIQAWDFRPGGNFVLDMQQAAVEAKRTVMVLSEAYLKALYTQPEWAAAFKQDPIARERKLLPIRVESCQPTGMLAPLVYVDLVGKSEAEAEALLLAALKDRDKPSTRPAFTQSVPKPERVTPTAVPFPAMGRVPDSASQRLDLFEKLASLPAPQFEQVLFGLNPPAGNVPTAQAGQSIRVKALLEWAESIGCGLDQVEDIYNRVARPR